MLLDDMQNSTRRLGLQVSALKQVAGNLLNVKTSNQKSAKILSTCIADIVSITKYMSKSIDVITDILEDLEYGEGHSELF